MRIKSQAQGQVRERIEVAGRDARWEFPRGAMFSRSSHIAGVCTDLSAMVATVAELRTFLGPQLKAITGDTAVSASTICCYYCCLLKHVFYN